MPRDLIYALRSLRRSPLFAAVAVLTLALGIGGTTAMFSLVNSIVLQPLGYREPHRLYGIYSFIPKFAKQYPVLPVNARHALTWREQSKAFEQITASSHREFTLTGSGGPERVRGARVCANFFSVLGARPGLGREFRPDEDEPGRDRVVMIGEELWRRRLGGDASILGRKLVLDGEPYEVIGIVPASFPVPRSQAVEALARREGRIELWKPMAFTPDERKPVFGEMNFECLGRLAPGFSAAQGLEELNRIQKALAQGDRDAANVQTILKPMKANVVGDAAQALTLLLAAVGFVLLIVCVNLTNLLLARHAARQRELAVRAALGARLGQLMRHAFAESLVLAGAGGALGVALAYGVVGFVTTKAGARLPRLAEVRVDTAVLLFALGISMLSALLCGLLPALRARRVTPQHALPGVCSAGIVSQLPVTSETSVNAVLPKESPEIPFIQRPVVNFRWASSDYFRAVGIPLVAGRIFQESDGDQRVVVLTERLAWRLWPNQDPIGREIRRYDPDGFRVVGIVRDVPAAALDRGPTAMVYFPYWQRRSYVMNVVVRAGVAPSALAGALRRAILQLDPEVPISELRTLEQFVSGSVDQRRFQMTLLLSFALLALLLACCGIYGVVAYSVTRRTGEIGIRAALGASRGEVCAMVLRQGLVPVAFGLLLGLGGSLAAGRAVSSFLYGTQALDPLTYGVVTATLGAVAFAACYAPALRASRIDPSNALRYE